MNSRNILTYAATLALLAACSGVCEKTPVPFDLESAPAPLFRDPVYDGAADPSVIWNDRTGEWWIFYTQRRATLDGEDVEFCFGTDIGIATSADAGRSWRYVGTADIPSPKPGAHTYWAPDVRKFGDCYYMGVSYMQGVSTHWGLESEIVWYRSDDLIDWTLVEEVAGTSLCIDPSVVQLPDGSYKMWYKTWEGRTKTALSTDLDHWEVTGNVEVERNCHEAPLVFRWQDRWWMITDPCTVTLHGLDCYESTDASNWTFNNTILSVPGKRPDDNDQGRHCDVTVVDGRAFIVYFTHPGIIIGEGGAVLPIETFEGRRSSLQIAELEYVDGKLVCNRDRYCIQQ